MRGSVCRRVVPWKTFASKSNGLEEMRVMKQVTEHRRVFRRDGGEGWTDRAQTSLWTISAMSYVSAID